MTRESIPTRLLGFEKACVERLAIGKTKAWELAKTGQIKTIRLGRKTLVAESELERFVRALEGEAA